MSDELLFESAVDQEGFTQLPNVVLKDGSISPQAKVLYALLRSFAWSSDSSFPGQERLAAHMGACERTVRTYLAELTDVGLVRVERRGATKSNRYVLAAVGLWAARRDRQSAAGHGDRQSAAGVTGSLLPEKKTQRKKTQTQRVNARERALKIAGKPVSAERWAMTARVLAEFCEQSGRSLSATTGSGEPSESAKRIYQRLVAHPDLSFEQHADVIRRTLASRWWGEDPPSVGVVYGPKVFEDNLTRPATSGRNGKVQRDVERAARKERDREAIERLMRGER